MVFLNKYKKYLLDEMKRLGKKVMYYKTKDIYFACLLYNDYAKIIEIIQYVRKGDWLE